MRAAFASSVVLFTPGFSPVIDEAASMETV
jgi:hypothetical protein